MEEIKHHPLRGEAGRRKESTGEAGGDSTTRARMPGTTTHRGAARKRSNTDTHRRRPDTRRDPTRHTEQRAEGAPVLALAVVKLRSLDVTLNLRAPR